MKICLLLITFLTLGYSTFGQSSAVVISENANLRGTPTERGKIVDTVPELTFLEIIKRKGVWFLVQSDEYVGWIHGNTIRLLNDSTSEIKPSVPQNSIRTPQKTNKQPTSSERLFEREFVGGGGSPTISIKNDANRTVTLTFGGVKYVIPSGKTTSLTVEPGNYEYFASAPGVKPLSGIERYDVGYSYSWRFFISRY